MLATLIPLFDKDLKVFAYSLFSQKVDLLKNPGMQGFGRNDGAGAINGLDLIKDMGIDTLANDTDVFVPVGNIAVFSPDIEEQNFVPRKRIILLFDHLLTPDEKYIERLKQLRAVGYRMAMRKLQISEFQDFKPVLDLMDYIFLDCKKVDVLKAKIYFKQVHPKISIIVGNLTDMDKFDQLKEDDEYAAFEGEFYRVPITKGDSTVSPLKANYLQLLQMVNDPDFELTRAADIIGRDTALVLELLKMVNRMTVNNGITTIRHAAAMLGQKELKRWINTAVTKELCSDKPNEITRLSLLRAKFAEDLAPLYDLKLKSSELFLMGLFSVLDLILDMPMAEALEKVNVSKDIFVALVEHQGALAPVLDLITQYENANWQEVSRLMMVAGQDTNDVYEAYISAVHWYREVFFA
ncbi:MAG: HDOD domain-containing protein [Lachnospiraceae bacterium]|nr:HDOD domain-containing protein [Lachnospiraceae bacterium]